MPVPPERVMSPPRYTPIELTAKLVALLREVQALADGIHTVSSSGGLIAAQVADLQEFAGEFAVALRGSVRYRGENLRFLHLRPSFGDSAVPGPAK